MIWLSWSRKSRGWYIQSRAEPIDCYHCQRANPNVYTCLSSYLYAPINANSLSVSYKFIAILGIAVIHIAMAAGEDMDDHYFILLL